MRKQTFFDPFTKFCCEIKWACTHKSAAPSCGWPSHGAPALLAEPTSAPPQKGTRLKHAHPQRASSGTPANPANPAKTNARAPPACVAGGCARCVSKWVGFSWGPVCLLLYKLMSPKADRDRPAWLSWCILAVEPAVAEPQKTPRGERVPESAQVLPSCAKTCPAKEQPTR